MCLGLTATYDGNVVISAHTQEFQQLVAAAMPLMASPSLHL